jgi:L-lactate dehydrogenase complex protein LldG
MSSRERILARIRANLGKEGGEPLQPELTPVADYLASHPSGPSPAARWDDQSVRFIERAQGLSSTVDEVSSISEAPLAIRRYLDANGLSSIGVCWPTLAELPWSDAGINLAVRPANDTDLLGITSAFCAIAETGTLMLLSGPETAATTSLLPETHIAIINAERIVKSMEDAWALLRLERGVVPRAVNFVSGPSRTADIEQTIIIGAHGPYRVHIILVRRA